MAKKSTNKTKPKAKKPASKPSKAKTKGKAPVKAKKPASKPSKAKTKGKAPVKAKKPAEAKKTGVNPFFPALSDFKYNPEEIITIPETGKKVKAKELPMQVVINLKTNKNG